MRRLFYFVFISSRPAGVRRTLLFAGRGRSAGGAIRNGAGLLANPRQAPVSATPNCGPAKSNLRLVLVVPFATKRYRPVFRPVIPAKAGIQGHRGAEPDRKPFSDTSAHKARLLGGWISAQGGNDGDEAGADNADSRVRNHSRFPKPTLHSPFSIFNSLLSFPA